MKNVRSHPWSRDQNLHLNKILRWFLSLLKVEKYCSKVLPGPLIPQYLLDFLQIRLGFGKLGGSRAKVPSFKLTNINWSPAWNPLLAPMLSDKVQEGTWPFWHAGALFFILVNNYTIYHSPKEPTWTTCHFSGQADAFLLHSSHSPGHTLPTSDWRNSEEML